MKTDQELHAAGFTISGTKRYKATAEIYCDQLYKRSVSLGELDKAPDAPREVTHEHVRSAAAALAVKGLDTADRLGIACQIGEYLAAIAAGVGGGRLDQHWGILLLAGSATTGVILFLVRTNRSRAK